MTTTPLQKTIQKTGSICLVCLIGSITEWILYKSGKSDLLEMQDEDASKSKMQKRKSLVQTPGVSQLQAYNETWQEEAQKVPKPSQKNPKNENPLKRFESSRSPQDGGLTESSPLTAKPGNEYRALRRKYLLLEEEGFSLREELEQIDADVKKLEEEKLALLDELVVLEGLVEPPAESPSHKA